MSANLSTARLARITKDLAETWHQTQEKWQDVKCQEFERTYMDPLFKSVNASLPLIEELNRILRKVRTDCE